MSEAGSGRVWFISAKGFGSEPKIVGEPSHIVCVVHRFVGRETEGGGSVENQLSVLFVADDDVGRVGSVSG